VVQKLSNLLAEVQAETQGLSRETGMTIEPWQRRRRRLTGDSDPQQLFCAVGFALTMWETIESEISVSYLGLIDVTTRYIDRYFKLSGFESRHKAVKQAVNANINAKDCAQFGVFIDEVLNYSPRRHEIAHGRVFNLGERGYILAPNNTLNRNYPNGKAVYQYASEDVIFYATRFKELSERAAEFARHLCHRRET
jgi:hypothetical protein